MKKRINRAKDKLIKYIKRVKVEHLIKKYIDNNVIFLTFVLTCVLNSTLLRFFTMHTIENYLAFKPILADVTILILVGSFGYLFKPKNRFLYFMICEIFFTAICMINSCYYTFYTSFASVSMLSLTQYITSVGDAVVENVMQPKDFVYLIGPIILVINHIRIKKKSYYKKIETKPERKKRTIKTLTVGGVLAVLFSVTLTPLDVTRFAKQWNREYIVMRFGIYIYQFNDVVTSLQPKINSLFGYDNAMKSFKEYYENTSDEPQKNEYSNIFEGKNVLVIHAESMQTNLLDLEFNGNPVVPNLKKLASEGMFFSNFYSQVSVGTSSDSELTYNTSLMPTQSGTAFVSYFDRDYNATPKYMSELGYYTFCMHANNADFWNRRNMYEHLGYQKFFSKENYKVDKENIVGLGLSDKEFFKQSVEKLKDVNSKKDKWYGLMIMLSNHTPFSDVEKYGKFDVDIKEKTSDEESAEEISHPYMEGTKLGNYFKSAHYADEALGELFTLLEENGLLDNTVVVLYGDHDARLPKREYNYMYNYDKETNKMYDKNDERYKEYDSYQYELGRKVPFIIWTKDMKDTKLNMEVKDVMGMYDVMPTLGNMFGFYNKYQLGHDIFNIKDNNIVVFPTGNWVTNKVYYNSQKEEYLSLDNSAIGEDEIKKNSEYASKLLNVSNNIITYDLIAKLKQEKEILNYKEGE